MGSFCASHDYQELKAMERATSDYVMGRASLEDIWELLESGDGESHIGTEKLRSALLGAFLFFSMVYNPKRKKVPSAKQAEPYVDKLFGYVARKVDKDGDDKISREDFDEYGHFLKNEFHKMTQVNAAKVKARNGSGVRLVI
uniref:EF-hand domain-containing protein n=1 Tax=Amorphochlora amoebiformis TaxID=1561963 RepID=A0A7S0DI20_9EUKA|mmetsp:Transcript_25819/g.40879  ORF Transcript_25819/g.40879 Transcript_25819/m.40879 type:complete len:142 (+) Transcript_25819:51-476(+)